MGNAIQTEGDNTVGHLSLKRLSDFFSASSASSFQGSVSNTLSSAVSLPSRPRFVDDEDHQPSAASRATSLQRRFSHFRDA